MRGSGERVRAVTAGVLIGAFLVALASPAVAYHAERQEELERLISETRSDIAALNAREQDLLARLNASSQRQAEAEAALRAVETRLALARAELQEIEVRLDRVAAELGAINRELEATLADLDDQITQLNARVRAIYMGSPEPYSEVLSRIDNFSDLADATAYADRVVASDSEIVAEIEATKARVEARRAEIEERKALIERERATARRTTERIAAIVAERAGVEAVVAREVATQRALLHELRSRRDRFREVLSSYERESARIEAFLQGAQSGQSAIQGRGGWLKWPVSGPITSDYGWRTHPVYGYRSFHTGIDIGAGMGTTVKAARKGRVVYTGYNGAYGLVVLIDHGNAVATMYAHLSQTYVREGERVRGGEAVAAVGSTGWSTGPHLHFEVRVHGQHSNPRQWL